jgi:hypothetical protein
MAEIDFVVATMSESGADPAMVTVLAPATGFEALLKEGLAASFFPTTTTAFDATAA